MSLSLCRVIFRKKLCQFSNFSLSIYCSIQSPDGGHDGNDPHLRLHLKSRAHRQRLFRKHLKTAITASLKQRTCPDLGNITFTNAPPFNVLGVPECGDAVQPKMELYLPVTPDGDTPQCDIDAQYLPNDVTTECLNMLRADKRVTRVAIVIHGFLKSFQTEWMHQFQQDIQSVEPNNTAVLVRGRESTLEGEQKRQKMPRNAYKFTLPFPLPLLAL